MRFIFLLPLLIFGLLAGITGFALFSTLSGTRQVEQLPSVLVERPAPDTRQPNLTEGAPEVDLSHYRGQIVLVNFFASWCVPCRAEIPMLQSLAKDLTVIGIAYKDKVQDTKAFLTRFGNPYHVVGVDLDGRTGITWGVYGIPETYLIDAQGNVLFRHAGVVDKVLIENTLRPLWETAG
ncbi:MAG: DsbE family thiol:disulfide interchange protein [Alphaproteobacteria bacterium]|nr:DsbE family thiol:disulfide interchange protein [Alphaproteobacteria bacterium]